jgi:N-acetylneuraminic acid mutarotase
MRGVSRSLLSLFLIALMVSLCFFGTAQFGKAQILEANSSGAIASQIAGASNSWENKASLPTPGEHGAAVVNGIIYVIGGSGNFAYNPNTDNWTTIALMLTPRDSFAVAACDNKIYVIGGVELGFQFPLYYSSDISYSSVNEVYDPSTNTWATKASMPIGTNSMQANTVNGKIYVIGGSIVTAGTPPYTYASPTVNFTEIYDPVTDSWTRGAPIPYPVIGYASAVVDNKIYVMGGQDEYALSASAPTSVTVSYTQVYDPSTNTWSLGASAPTGTFQAAAGATTGLMAPKRIYVFGGSIGFGEGSNQTYAYEPSTNTWSTAASMPTACYGPAVAVVNDVLYVIGGGEFMGSLSNNEQYTPVGYEPITASPSPTPSTPEFPSLIILALVIILAGSITVLLNAKKHKKC